MIDRLNREILRILDLPDVSKQLFVEGALERIGNSPDEFAAILRREAADYARIVKISGAKAE